MAEAHGWFEGRRGWYHPNAWQFWGWQGVTDPVCYRTVEELIAAEQLTNPEGGKK
jgi:hypothetical protein